MKGTDGNIPRYKPPMAQTIEGTCQMTSKTTKRVNHGGVLTKKSSWYVSTYQFLRFTAKAGTMEGGYRACMSITAAYVKTRSLMSYGSWAKIDETKYWKTN